MHACACACASRQLRYWRSTLAQTVGAPVVFMLLLFALQQADYANQSRSNFNPPSSALEGVYRCQGRGSASCINLMFTPDTPATRAYLQVFADQNAKRTGEPALKFESAINDVTFLPNRAIDMVPVPQPEFLYQYTLRNPNVTAWGIQINDVPSATPRNVQYQIWYNGTRVANSSDVFGRQLTSFIRGMDESIVTVLNDPTATVRASIDVTMRDWPLVPPSVLSDTIVQNLGQTLFFSCTMLIFINCINQIVTEKEQKLRHGMEMMGLRPFVYWLSTFLSNTALVAASSLVTCLLGLAFRFNAFKNTNFGVLFVTFFLLGESMLMFGFCLTTFVRRARVAILAGIFIFIVGLLFEAFVFSSGFVGYIWWKNTMPSFVPNVLGLLPFFNFGKCFLDISSLTTGKLDELTGTYIPGPGFAWSDLYTPIPTTLQPTYPDGSTPNIPAPIQSWYMMMLDVVIFGVITWYADCVIPDEYGYAEPLWFFVLPTYWGWDTRRDAHVAREDWLAEAVDRWGREINEDDDSDVAVERSRTLSPAYWPAAKIVHLRKVYTNFFGGNEKIAIKDLCLTIEEGKLLALLGQNGAGKTSTMNILSGLTPATSGDANLYGLSVRRQMHRIHKMMGICPQHDILFADLTAREHVYLYAGLKGVPRKQWDLLVVDRLQSVRLLRVADDRSKTYSGGMRRRLSLIISTIGDPKIVFLDEPTTGMDPVNRRHVWNFIENFKLGRIVVLTTHSMEEADVLGDRIAIMAHGRLRAIGNSVTLKSKFGEGYRISIVTDPARNEEAKALVMNKMPNATLEDDSAGSLIYQFPVAATPLIPEFVRQLEANPYGLIRAWAISQTTLEEVFLKIIRDANPGGYMGDEGVVMDDAPPVP
eukprot:jgi/Hompol1/3210/HPOL_001591-RA